MELMTLTDAELGQLQADVQKEIQRRSDLVTIPETVSMLNLAYLAAEGTEPGQEWRAPTDATNSYPVGWQVIYGGKTWESTTPFNVWEPGVAAWREVVPEGAPPPEWKQPDSTNPYMKGAQVTFEGQVWESLIDNNVWSPTGYPQGWKLVSV